MCTVLIAWRCYRDVPLIVAGNRDELIARPSSPPQRLAPHITGGRDLLAGGTWLAVSDDGRVCTVTNRHRAGDEVHRDPTRRSRGEIPVEVLQHEEADVPALLRSFGPGVYNPVNVLYASTATALVAETDDAEQPRVLELGDGVHVLTVRDLDDRSGEKDRFLQRRLGAALAAADSPEALLAAMESVLRSHESPTGDPLDAACIHGEQYGTVSSATVLVDAGGAVTFRFADGRPCETGYATVAVG
ncbi:MAG: NRDE family protein [Candidatus Dormibacteraeota bacterium]|nr:NRDE family protein [Candidatus Dormibacteraeota bacterium]